MRSRRPLTLATLAVAAAAAVAATTSAASFATSAPGRLIGTVGPGFDISLKHASGTPVTRLRAGTYLLVVHDRSAIHDFHLTGPGVNRVVTGVAFVGTRTIRLQLRAGLYRYVCDPHAFVMHGRFRVT